MLELVADYNAGAAPDERLQGVQFDIEPYVDPGFWDDVEGSLQACLLTIEGIVDAYEEVRAWPGNEGLIRREFDYASGSGAACGIVVGQEFTEVTPETLSFWWAGRAAFRQAAEELTEAYGGLPQAQVLEAPGDARPGQFQRLGVAVEVVHVVTGGDPGGPRPRRRAGPGRRG